MRGFKERSENKKMKKGRWRKTLKKDDKGIQYYFYVVGPVQSSSITLDLKTVAMGFSETSVYIYKSTRRYNSEGNHR
jgi:hypothetical protein